MEGRNEGTASNLAERGEGVDLEMANQESDTMLMLGEKKPTSRFPHVFSKIYFFVIIKLRLTLTVFKENVFSFNFYGTNVEIFAHISVVLQPTALFHVHCVKLYIYIY